MALGAAMVMKMSQFGPKVTMRKRNGTRMASGTIMASGMITVSGQMTKSQHLFQSYR